MYIVQKMYVYSTGMLCFHVCTVSALRQCVPPSFPIQLPSLVAVVMPTVGVAGWSYGSPGRGVSVLWMGGDSALEEQEPTADCIKVEIMIVTN